MLTFRPAKSWQNATTYTISVGSGARDTAGNPFGSAYTFSFTVGKDFDPPTMSAFPLKGDKGPACGFLGATDIVDFDSDVCHIASGLKLRLTFSESMDQTETAAAFSVEPKVEGDLSWVTPTELLFTPREDLVFGQQYKLTLSAGARDLGGNTMVEPFIRYFTTGDGNPADSVPPRVASIFTDLDGSCDGSYDDVNLYANNFQNLICTDNAGSGSGARIAVNFTEASNCMDTSLTSQAFSINPGASGYITWPTTNTMLFTATRALDPGEQYTLNLTTAATDCAGNNLQDGVVLYFTTGTTGGYPAVSKIEVERDGTPCGVPTDILSVTVQDGCTNGNSPVVVSFTEAMNRVATEGAFSVSPAIAGNFQWAAGDTVMTFTPDEAFTYGSRYTVELSTNVRDAQGHALAELVRGSFVAGALDLQPPDVTDVKLEQNNDGDGCGGVPDDVTVTGNPPAPSTLRTSVSATASGSRSRRPWNGPRRSTRSGCRLRSRSITSGVR